MPNQTAPTSAELHAAWHRENTARREHLDGRSAFRPVEVGVSPGGVVWVAYRPEHVAPMRLRLAALRTREATRARLAAEVGK